MARYSDPGFSRAKVDKFVEDWKEQCLIDDGSMLFDDRALWTTSNLEDFRKRFLDNPLLGTEQNFDQKLATQLETSSDDVRWLVCELVAVYFLFARGAISGRAKRATLEKIIEPFKDKHPPHWQRLAETMDEGIGNPGAGYNIRRDTQIGYLIDFCLRFKAIDDKKKRLRLLEEPWELRDFADASSDGISVRAMRHILLHLLRPDEFERISSGEHKQDIIDAFADELLVGKDVPEDLDERLLLVREKLGELDAQPDAHSGILDFYYPPLYNIWDPGANRADGASDLDLLLYKKQIVLYGPPGTGKTHRTRELAKNLIHRQALQKWKVTRYFSSLDEIDAYVKTNVCWVQLHPGYGYEEFIRGLRISTDGSTEYVSGLLPKLVEEMKKVPKEDQLPVVMVLDEINRTDLSRLFGEAFSLLENREESVLLPGFNDGDEPQKLSLPENLYVIGTMNLIDQSVEELDFALRRRFFWRPANFERMPIIEVNEQRWKDHAPTKWGWDRAVDDMTLLADRAEKLNQQIAASPHLGQQYEIGHTYFFDAAFFAGRWLRGRKQLSGGVLWTAKDKPRPSIEDLWTFSLEPLLGQYLGGLDAETAKTELERLRNVLFTGQVE